MAGAIWPWSVPGDGARTGRSGLVEELELAHPDKVAGFERRHPDAMAAVAGDDLEACDPEELDELASDLRSLLRV